MSAALFDAAPVRHTQVGPTRYAWRQFGKGPALLLVHGFPLSGFTWRKVLPELSRHFTCYVPDLAGLGDTQWTAATDFTWHGQSRGLQQLMSAIGVPRYSAMGHDTGGTFARCLALMDLERIDRLVIVNSEIPGHRPPWIPLYQALMYVPGTLAGFSLLLRSRTFLRSGMGFGGCFDDLGLIDGEFHERFVEPLLQEPQRLQGMKLYLRELKWPVVDAFAAGHAKLAMPVRLIWGADDPTFPIARARAMRGQFPRADLVEIPRARLLVHEERPAEVAKAAIEFLAAA